MAEKGAEQAGRRTDRGAVSGAIGLADVMTAAPARAADGRPRCEREPATTAALYALPASIVRSCVALRPGS